VGSIRTGHAAELVAVGCIATASSASSGALVVSHHWIDRRRQHLRPVI
jgi:hypothetical protein